MQRLFESKYQIQTTVSVEQPVAQVKGREGGRESDPSQGIYPAHTVDRSVLGQALPCPPPHLSPWIPVRPQSHSLTVAGVGTAGQHAAQERVRFLWI